MKTKLLFEGWRKFVNEDDDKEGDLPPPTYQECFDGCINSALKLGLDLDQAEKDCAAECAEYKKKNVNEAYDEEEYATAGGMEQDIEMRRYRGDFEQGDYGNVGPGGGEMVDHGEYPWIKDALEDLQDEEFDDKVKALEALADELGIEITTEEAEEEEDLNEQ
tara:strand:+ start:11773 stop:12261 length:489 start_codon:yes stop_codon:yes gene_type:complete